MSVINHKNIVSTT